MAFNQTNLNEIKIYQLPQTVYDNMLAANEIDEDGFYLTTGGNESSDSSNVVFEPSASSEGSSTTLGTLTINGVANELYVPASADVQAVGEKTSSEIMPVFFGSSVLPNTSSSDGSTGVSKLYYNSSVGVQPSSGVLYGAAWNDYAETRRAYSEDFKYMKPGCVVTECAIENDTVRLTDKRLEKIPMVITDTYGFLIGEKEGDIVPVAVAGRVLVNTYEDRNKFELGDAVCSGPNGTVSIMTYEELLTFPDRVLGYVSCIPDYDTWNGVKVNNRIWIKLK